MKKGIVGLCVGNGDLKTTISLSKNLSLAELSLLITGIDLIKIKLLEKFNDITQKVGNF